MPHAFIYSDGDMIRYLVQPVMTVKRSFPLIIQIKRDLLGDLFYFISPLGLCELSLIVPIPSCQISYRNFEVFHCRCHCLHH